MTEEEQDKMFALEMTVISLQAELAGLKLQYGLARTDLARAQDEAWRLHDILIPPRSKYEMIEVPF